MPWLIPAANAVSPADQYRIEKLFNLIPVRGVNVPGGGVGAYGSGLSVGGTMYDSLKGIEMPDFSHLSNDMGR